MEAGVRFRNDVRVGRGMEVDAWKGAESGTGSGDDVWKGDAYVRRGESASGVREGQRETECIL